MLPLYLEPNACAASSNKIKLCLLQIFNILSISHVLPFKWVIKSALVLELSIFQLNLDKSTYLFQTLLELVYNLQSLLKQLLPLYEMKQLFLNFFIPEAIKNNCIPSVALPTPKTYLDLVYFLFHFQNFPNQIAKCKHLLRKFDEIFF